MGQFSMQEMAVFGSIFGENQHNNCRIDLGRIASHISMGGLVVRTEFLRPKAVWTVANAVATSGRLLPYVILSRDRLVLGTKRSLKN